MRTSKKGYVTGHFMLTRLCMNCKNLVFSDMDKSPNKWILKIKFNVKHV